MNSNRPANSENLLSSALSGGILTRYLIPTKNLNSDKIQRIFVTAGLDYSLVYGQGAEDPDPESTLTYEFACMDRVLAESIFQLIAHLNQGAVLIEEAPRKPPHGNESRLEPLRRRSPPC